MTIYETQGVEDLAKLDFTNIHKIVKSEESWLS